MRVRRVLPGDRSRGTSSGQLNTEDQPYSTLAFFHFGILSAPDRTASFQRKLCTSVIVWVTSRGTGPGLLNTENQPSSTFTNPAPVQCKEPLLFR